MRRGVQVWLVVLVVCASSATVSAQSARDLATAREQFRAGVASGQAGQWSRALDSFQRAYDLSHHADVLLNVAAAQIELGHLVDAGESYRRFLTDATPEMRTAHGAEVQTALTQLEHRVAHLHVTLDGPAAGTHVQVDGETLEAAEIGVDLPVDPGDHALVLFRGTDTIASASAHLAEGERHEVTLPVSPVRATTPTAGPGILRVAAPEAASSTAVPAAATRPDAPPTAHGDDSTLIITLSVIGGVLLVGGAVAIGVVATGAANPQASPYQGSISPFSIPIGP